MEKAIYRHYRRLYKKSKGVKYNMTIASAIAGVLNGIIVFIVLSILVAILGLVGLGQFGAIVQPFIFWVAVLVGLLTFFGYVPNYFPNYIK